MTDPTTWKDRASSLYVSFAVPLLSFYALMIPVLSQYGYEWHPFTGIAAGAVGAIGTALRAGWFGPQVRALLVVLLLAGGSVSCGHQNPYLIAYRSLGMGRAGFETLRDTLGAVCHAKRVTCLETHGAGTAAYDTCWAQCRAAEQAWVRYLRPAANTALATGLTSIQLAEVAKTKPEVAVYLRPLACLSGEVLALWGHLLPPSIKEEAAIWAGIAKGYACPKAVAP